MCGLKLPENMSDKEKNGRYYVDALDYVSQKFFAHFQIHIRYFFTGFDVAFGSMILIKIYEFDDHLKQKHKDYTDEFSMSEIVHKHYGQEAHEFLKKLI